VSTQEDTVTEANPTTGRTAPMKRLVQLVVEYANHQTRFYPANPGWRIDAANRCIVIGRDLPRTYVPLDGVVAWHVELVEPTPVEGQP